MIDETQIKEMVRFPKEAQGVLYVVSGPSGVGKSAICAGILERTKAMLSVSMTTRAKRGNEEEGKDYFFVTGDRFGEIAREGGFFEYAEIYGDYYGTPKAPVLEALKSGRDVMLEIDVNGAKQIKSLMPEAILVFIMPPSPDILRKRIEGRGTESPERIAQRLGLADSEISQLGEYHYYVVNDDLDAAISDVHAIMAMKRQSPPDSSGDTTAYLSIGSNAEKIIKLYKAGNLKRAQSANQLTSCLRQHVFC